jgi:hypothetical protein
LALSRHYSLYVALQLKARSLGLPTPVYGAPEGYSASNPVSMSKAGGTLARRRSRQEV